MQLKVPLTESSAGPDGPPVLITLPMQVQVGFSLLAPNTDQVPQELKKDQRRYKINTINRPANIPLIF